MFNRRNSRRIRLLWLCRARVFLLCRWRIVSAVRSSSLAEARLLNQHERMNADAAKWIWQTVSSGFFFPQLLFRPRQKQKADCAQNHVPLQPQITPTFIMIQTDFPLAILEAAFHAPTGKADQQQRAGFRLRGCVA